MKHGFFITLEGNDGAGKTTVALGLKKELERRGYEVVYTREPGGSKIAEKIRDILLNDTQESMDARTEALLFAASRRQHLKQIVIPAIKALPESWDWKKFGRSTSLRSRTVCRS